MNAWLRYLIAFVVGCHGLTYLLFGFVPDVFKGWRGRSWLLGGVLTGARLKALMVVLHAGAGVATLACAVAIGFGPAMPGW